MTLRITHPSDGHGYYIEDDQDVWGMSGPYLDKGDAEMYLAFRLERLPAE